MYRPDVQTSEYFIISVVVRIETCEGIVVYGILKHSVVDMRINLSGGDALVAEYQLKSTDVDVSVFVHQCCRGVAEFVDRIDFGVLCRPRPVNLFNCYLNHVV